MMGIVNGIMTVALMAIFTGIVVWAWRRERRQQFDEAAALPLEEDVNVGMSAGKGPSKGQSKGQSKGDKR
jgi:cytochrome c oxidase cbb3-type subunit 4